MKHDISAIRDSERLAMNLLTSPFMAVAKGTAGSMMGKDLAAQYPMYGSMLNPFGWYTGNQFYTDARLITMPSTLQQEVVFDTTGTYTFNFAATNAVAASATLNNFTLPQNNVAAVYAMRLRLGYGATSNTRQYQTYGATLSDNSIYNSNAILTIESENQMTNFSVDDFKEVPDNNPRGIEKYSGMMLINPVRIISGKLGVFQVQIKTLSSLAGLDISPNLYLSLTLMCAFGQASGGPPVQLAPAPANS
jgi:hypothetical protein